MPESRAKKFTRNIIWGFCGRLVSLLMPFFTRTALIYTVGIQYVGLNGLFSSLLTVLSFTELGIGSALVFAMYKPMAENNVAQINALLNLYRRCYRLVGAIVSILGLSFLPFLDVLIDGDVPPDLNVRYLFCFFLLNTVVGYFSYAYKTSLFVASQRVDVTSKVNAAVNITTGVIQIALIVTCGNYYLYVLVMPIMTLVNNLCIGLLSKRAFPEFVCAGEITRRELTDIAKNIAGLIFAKLGSIILGASDSLVISAFFGLWSLGVYNGYAVIVSAAAGILQTVQSSLIPSIGNKLVTDEKDESKRLFKLFNFAYMWISIVMFACLVGTLEPLIVIWQGANNTLSQSIPLLLCLSFLVQRSGEMSWMFREAAGLWWQGKHLPFISSLLNLTLNIILVNYIGLEGVVLSTIIALAVVNLPFGALILFKHYFHSLSDCASYLIESIAYIALGCAIGLAVHYLCFLVPIGGIEGLILRLLICVGTSNVLLLVIFFKTNRIKGCIRYIRGMAVTMSQNNESRKKRNERNQGF